MTFLSFTLLHATLTIYFITLLHHKNLLEHYKQILLITNLAFSLFFSYPCLVALGRQSKNAKLWAGLKSSNQKYICFVAKQTFQLCKAKFVRPGTAGLLTGIECSRVSDSSWMYFTSFVTTLIGVVLAAVQGNYPIVL